MQVVRFTISSYGAFGHFTNLTWPYNDNKYDIASAICGHRLRNSWEQIIIWWGNRIRKKVYIYFDYVPSRASYHQIKVNNSPNEMDGTQDVTQVVLGEPYAQEDEFYRPCYRTHGLLIFLITVITDPPVHSSHAVQHLFWKLPSIYEHQNTLEFHFTFLNV